MRDFTWEDSVSILRQAHYEAMPITLGLLISEIEMRWNDVNINNYGITPLPQFKRGFFGGEDVVYQWPYSGLLFLRRPSNEEERPDFDFFPAWWGAANIGPAMSSILSFVMRCSVVAYNASIAPLQGKKDNIKLTSFGRIWSEGWNNSFEFEKDLRGGVRRYHPSPRDEQDLIKTMTQIYDILMSLDEETYHSIMGTMRLYQLAFFAAREDSSLAYSLLVAAVDAASTGQKVKVKLRDIDPEGKLTKLMAEFDLDEQLQTGIKSLVVHHETLTKRISRFIDENYGGETFWKELDQTIFREMMGEEGFRSGQLDRDLSKNLPEPIRQRLIKEADRLHKEYESWKKKVEKAQGEQRWIFNKRQREWMLPYLQTNLSRVLANTFGSRSELFHRGRGFPKFALKEKFMEDWIPDVFEEDFRDFIGEHLQHKWDYRLTQKGKIFRTCSCGDRKEVKVILGIQVFERIVHDSILNYILRLAR